MSKEEAVTEVYKVRSLVADAWVFTGVLENLQGEPIVSDVPIVTENGDTETTDTGSGSEGGNLSSELTNSEGGEQSAGGEGQEEKRVAENDITEPGDDTENEMTQDEATAVQEPEVDGEYKIYINTTNKVKLSEVFGELEVLDWIRNRSMKDINAHKLEGVNDPKNGDSSVEFAHRIFGFRPLSVRVNLTDPASDTTGLVSTIGDSIVVDMPLISLQHGDLAVLWHVLFFKDAAIMRPESQAELNSLLDLLKQNPNFNVVLHGHTNGSGSGNIIHLNTRDMEFFSMNGEHKESKGSAKRLSEERAFTIQQWLLQQGISESRISVKGWGGKRMLYEEDDARAFLNVRVEVEVLEEGK